MENRTAVILCGGKGSRLGSIGKKLPKTLVRIHSKPILWYVIKNLEKNKFNHLILPVGYKGKMIKNYIKKNKKEFYKLKIDIVETGIETSIANRLFKIKKYIQSNDFILLNGDAIFDFNIFKLFNNHIKKEFDVTFLGNPAQLPYGVIIFEKNKITDFQRDIIFNSVQKNNKKNFIGYVYSGISIINKKIMNLQFKKYKNFEKEFYPKIIKKFKSNFNHIKGVWFSIDNQKDISSLHDKNTLKYNSIKKILKKIK
jgi:NDP-sugar pyrophosphorylase family protein